jgi:hypothetical protein
VTSCASPALAWDPADPDAVQTARLRWSLPMGCCDDAPDDLEDPVWLGMQAAGIEVVDRLSHRRFGGPCMYEVRPCPPTCCNCARAACCCGWERLNLQTWLPRRLRAIDKIVVNCAAFDGEVPEDEYWLANGRYLTPKRGGSLWPWPPQDLNTVPGDPGTWYIWAVAGDGPNQAILQAAAEVACQLWDVCNGRPCDVPTNAVSVSRDGVTVTLETGMIAGLPMVRTVKDLYGARRRPQRIWDPAGPSAAIREIGGGGVVSDGNSNIVISDTPPPDTTVVWIDTSGS